MYIDPDNNNAEQSHFIQYHQQVLNAIRNMDADGLDLLIREYDLEDESKPQKYHIMLLLETAFRGFRFLGDTYLIANPGACGYKQCHSHKTGVPHGYTFVGNKSGCHLSLIFEIEDPDVYNVFECRLFECSGLTLVHEKYLWSVLEQSLEWQMKKANKTQYELFDSIWYY